MMRRVLFGFAIVALAGAATASVDGDAQRRDYLAAHDALRANNLAAFRRLYDRLDGYVLRGYLDYEYLKDRLGSTPARQIEDFLDENAYAPISGMIREKWLHLLADRGDWKGFLRVYKDVDDPELQCLRLRQLLRTEVSQAPLMTEIEELWHTGTRLPPACAPVFEAWRKAGHMTADRVWERVRLTMESHNVSLASALGRFLDPAERVWVNRWVAMHRNPAVELARIRYPVETPVARMIVRHGVVRMAYRDPEEAMAQWERLKARYQFFGEDENYVLRYVGILAAQSHLPDALKWLSAVSADPQDETLHLWRVRAALRAGDWGTAKRFIAGLSEAQQHEPQWAYWKARILEQTGQGDEARRAYARLARDRSYYGFLAADHLGAPYSMQHASVTATPVEINTMLARPGVRAARELFQLGQITEARRQWAFSTRQMNNRELQVAAVIARQWGWHDRAILTVGRSDHQDDLDLRFPVLYRDVIEANASEYGLDPGWIYGIVRQESAFVVDARSPAGALGLMQLMPSTGRLTGRRLKVKVSGTRALLDIENNLKLGAGYLREMLGRYDGNQVLATASYNAGPHRVGGWMPAERSLDASIWVENIPYDETRGYVKNVMAFTAVYEHRLGLRPTRLVDRMPSVPAAE